MAAQNILGATMSTAQQSFTIRPATEADAESVVALINDAFRIVESFFVEGNRITLKEVREYLQLGEFLLAEDNNRLIACVYLEPRGERTYLGLLSVDPTLQKAGIGSSLMTAAEERWRDRNAKYIDILTVSLREELSAFYGKRGYVKTGTSPFPADVKTKLPVHFVNMSKRLDS
jgi:N-acetylglutamate synthase-like GNAT family acetyltransferase